MKKFWKKTEGFTLVELIVVIAILGILAGVGTVGYSGYIKKANMAADQQLIRDVENAIMLAYYAEPDKNLSGRVSLTTEGITATPNLTDAMVATFGADYTDLKLKYDGWSGDYQDSSYANNEASLLGKVDTLTGVLGGVLSNVSDLAGPGFQAYVESMGYEMTDTKAVSDLAVLYVADGTNKVASQDKKAVIDAIVGFKACDNATLAIMNVAPKLGGSTLTTAAALYAVAEGFCRYTDEKNGTNEYMELLNSKTTADNLAADLEGKTAEEAKVAALENVFNVFTEISTKALEEDETLFNKYFDEQAEKDATAFVDIMCTVAGSQSQFTDNEKFGTDDFNYANEAGALLDVYADGGVFVTSTVDESGLHVQNTARADG